MHFFKKIILSFILLAIGSQGHSQSDSSIKSLKVFLNCSSYNCYSQYLKTQTTWVYFVQDQFVADVNLRINTLPTGSGGDAYQLIFEGQKGLNNLRDTIQFQTNAINTDNEIRDAVLQHVQLGLVRYAIYTHQHDGLRLASVDSLDQNEIGIGSNPAEDPFNAWVFNLGLSNYSSGQKISNFFSTSANVSASQIKETHKTKILFYYNSSVNRYQYNGANSIYLRQEYNGYFFHTRSLNAHWSSGFFNRYTNSTYDNYRHSIANFLALEYNIYPYKESQTKQFTIAGYLGSLYNQYKDTTIYLRTHEWRPIAQLQTMCSFNQSWGNIDGGISTIALMDDFRKYNTSLNLSVNARIYKGLSISLSGSFSFIRNQINLPKEDASLDLILLQQQVLATNYSYYYYTSINYRFGSIFNNVVNTRFSSDFDF